MLHHPRPRSQPGSFFDESFRGSPVACAGHFGDQIHQIAVAPRIHDACRVPARGLGIRINGGNRQLIAKQPGRHQRQPEGSEPALDLARSIQEEPPRRPGQSPEAFRRLRIEARKQGGVTLDFQMVAGGSEPFGGLVQKLVVRRAQFGKPERGENPERLSGDCRPQDRPRFYPVPATFPAELDPAFGGQL